MVVQKINSKNALKRKRIIKRKTGETPAKNYCSLEIVYTEWKRT